MTREEFIEHCLIGYDNLMRQFSTLKADSIAVVVNSDTLHEIMMADSQTSTPYIYVMYKNGQLPSYQFRHYTCRLPIYPVSQLDPDEVVLMLNVYKGNGKESRFLDFPVKYVIGVDPIDKEINSIIGNMTFKRSGSEEETNTKGD